MGKSKLTEGRGKLRSRRQSLGSVHLRPYDHTPGANWGTDRGQEDPMVLQGKAACGEEGPRWKRTAASSPGSLGEPHPFSQARMETLKVKLRLKPELGK